MVPAGKSLSASETSPPERTTSLRLAMVLKLRSDSTMAPPVEGTSHMTQTMLSVSSMTRNGMVICCWEMENTNGTGPGSPALPETFTMRRPGEEETRDTERESPAASTATSSAAAASELRISNLRSKDAPTDKVNLSWQETSTGALKIVQSSMSM
jgi:hypothetical protein